MLIDSHCHLDARQFNDDRPMVICRARDAGVRAFLTIGCDVENSGRALGLAATHQDIYASVGVHPHEAGKAQPGYIDAIRNLAGHPRAKAIGECGLDYYYDHSPRDVQQDVFSSQVRLAQELGYPLVVHVRDAWDDCLRILRQEKPGQGVIHCFTGTLEQAKASLDLGFHISIPGIVTFKKAGELPDVAKEVPDERLLIETDSPYLAPAPHRGKRNEPAFVDFVAEKVAELRGVSKKSLIDLTGMNACKLFDLPLRPDSPFSE